MTRNRIWIGVSSQTVTVPLPRVVPPAAWVPAIVTSGAPGSYLPVGSMGGQCFRGSTLTAPGGWPDAGEKLPRLAWARIVRQDLIELAARVDAKLGEDLAQVVVDRARADEQPGADLRVGQAVP